MICFRFIPLGHIYLYSNTITEFFSSTSEISQPILYIHIAISNPSKVLGIIIFGLLQWIKCRYLNLQTSFLSTRVAKEHYDFPPLLYEQMLDKNMQYSCAYWGSCHDNSDIIDSNTISLPNVGDNYSTGAVNGDASSNKGTMTLELAQVKKMEMIVAKMRIKDGMNILDIGCGWGGLAAFIACRYPRSQVYGLSISEEQIRYATRTHCPNYPNLHFINADYRKPEAITKIKALSIQRCVSVGMLEHVGRHNMREYFETFYDIIDDGGLFLLHSITCQHETAYSDPWLEKHIFPGGWLPSSPRVIQEAEAQNFNCEDVHGFGLYYSRTLNAWARNFKGSWPELRKHNPMFFDDRFYRKFEYYLNLSEATFLTRQVNLHQFILTKKFNTVYARPLF